ncbi:MAG: bifunctional glutamate N-acetyltransferase/amino-acid acetyltransferase ArgJ [Deltaproteobacteria bacterium]|nr:bifunctional glutamate N-acetyltransferase/amino-acid acetyltransferase ArgJ [Deltaproteobacteria bacterium]
MRQRQEVQEVLRGRGPTGGRVSGSPLPVGFRYGATEAAVKKPGRLDLGLIWCEVEATAAGAFTRNRVQAAPVLLCRERIGAGKARAVLANSGNANACSGEEGLSGAKRLTGSAAKVLSVDETTIFPCSTGVIGLPLPVERMEAALPALRAALGEDPEPFARAIMTTDTFPKLSRRSMRAGDREVHLLGMAKGAGMIRPDMATMLAFVTTDARIGAPALSRLVSEAAEASFNRITVDGDTSTNDTLLVLASGCSGGEPLEADAAALAAFGRALADVCRDLARQMVRDGEGATKLVDVRVKGASDDAAALQIARTVAESPLVKTAIHGEDPNWGRIAAALGRSPGYRGGRFSIALGGVWVAKGGLGTGPETEAPAHDVMKRREYEVLVELEEGPGEATVSTCDFSADYVRINADYRS